MGGLELKTAGTHQIKDRFQGKPTPRRIKSLRRSQGSAIKALVSQRCDKMEMNELLSIDKNGTEKVHVTSDIKEIG